MDLDALINKLKNKGVIAQGLTEDEIATIECTFDFVFPQDFRQFLKIATFTGSAAVNWHDMKDIKSRMDWPWEGMAFDIENNGFWLEAWGPKPEVLSDQLRIAKEHYDQAPKLIPIFSHRYIPATPSEIGNPIFSVYQTDIIYYGYDLLSYIECEFDFRRYDSLFTDNHPFKKIDFWSELAK